MAVIRIERNKNYTTMSNYHLRDKNLSLKAKGLMSVILSLPNDWDYSIEGLVSILKEEKTAVKGTLNELKDHHYLIVLKLKPVANIRNNIEYSYTFFEKPYTNDDIRRLIQEIGAKSLTEQDIDELGIEDLYVDGLGVENNTQLNKDILNKDILNKDNNTSSSSYIGTPPTQDQLITFLEENGFYLSPIQYETILTWLNYDFDLIKYVVKNALNNNKLNIKYIDKVLFNLSRKNIKTVKQAEEDNRQFEEQKERQREEKRRNNYHYMTETEKANKEQEDFETMLDRVGNELQEKGIIK